MRAVLHVLATLVLLPYVVLAAAFAILGHAISGGGLWAFVDRLLEHALWIVPWGVLGFVFAAIALALLGAFPRTRWIGGLAASVLAAVSLAVILLFDKARIEAGELVFLLPCMLVVVFGAWLAIVERKARREEENVPLPGGRPHP